MESVSPLTCALAVLGAPLAGALIVALTNFQAPRLASWIGLLAAGAGLAGAGLLTAQLFAGQGLDEELFTWMAGDELEIGVGLLGQWPAAAQLAGMMAAGIVVHGYALSRGKDADREMWRLIGLQMAAFAAALVLLGDGYGLLCVGWGLLGLCAYFLIGDRQGEACRRAWKIWAIDRGGDAALALGMAGLLARTGRLDQGAVEAAVSAGETTAWIGALLLLAAVAKVAQVPFYVHWSTSVAGPAAAHALLQALAVALASAHLVMRSWPLCPPESALVLVGCAAGAVGLLIWVPLEPVRSVARFVRDVVDTLLIDLFLVGGVGLSVRGIGWLLARLQTGQVRFYLLGIAAGTVAVLFCLMRMR